VGVQNKAGINLKNRSPACKQCPVKHLCTSRPAGRNRSDKYAQDVEENNKRYQENHSYTEHDKIEAKRIENK
jgi:adenine-specific DNA glycosylase